MDVGQSKERRCGRCGALVHAKLVIRENGPHYADWRCPRCDQHMGFVPKPEADRIRRPSAQKNLVKKHGDGFCELCLRTADDLSKGESLMAHHIVEFSDGGTADANNVLIVCSGCHALVHWLRTYHSRKGYIHARKDSANTEASSRVGSLEAGA